MDMTHIHDCHSRGFNTKAFNKKLPFNNMHQLQRLPNHRDVDQSAQMIEHIRASPGLSVSSCTTDCPQAVPAARTLLYNASLHEHNRLHNQPMQHLLGRRFRPATTTAATGRQESYAFFKEELPTGVAHSQSKFVMNATSRCHQQRI